MATRAQTLEDKAVSRQNRANKRDKKINDSAPDKSEWSDGTKGNPPWKSKKPQAKKY